MVVNMRTSSELHSGDDAVISVFLVDDHGVLREGVKLLLNSQPDMRVVGEADSGRGLAAQINDSGADLVIIDVSMPGFTGAQATAELKKECPEIKMLALTRHTEKAYLQQMLEAGASGYVLKQAAANELISAVRTVARGGTYLDPSIAGKLIERSTRRSHPAGTDQILTDREREVVRMITLGHTNKEIGATLGISVKTVESHKTKIMQKLGISSRAELVRFAMSEGWMKDE